MAATRQQDELLLELVKLRCKGIDTPTLSDRYRRDAGYIRAATNRVKKEDEAHEVGASKGYW